MHTLGYPMINVEIHPDQLYEAISMATDFFTKYAGYTKEYLIFDSRLYEHNKGLRLDHLFTVANSDYTPAEILQNRKIGPDPDFVVDIPDPLFISLSAIPATYFTSSSALSSAVPDEGITKMQIIDLATYQTLTAFDANLVDLFQTSPRKSFTIACETQPDVTSFNNMFDYDIMDYRKVIDVINFQEGSTSGVNVLFSQESFLAQQSFYALGNFGFDMLSWHTVKDWIDTREKMFATNRDWYFDNRTQYLRLIPQPKIGVNFFGLIECYVERPVRDLVKEAWVLTYATALAKIMWGRVLTRFGQVQMLGGAILNGDNILSEGIEEKKELEELLYTGGMGDSEPPMFFVG